MTILRSKSKMTVAGALALVALTAVAMPAEAAPGEWFMKNVGWDLAPAGNGETNVHALRMSGQFGYAGVYLPAGMQVADITQLSFDVFFESGGCGGGSPRAMVGVDTNANGKVDKVVHVYGGGQPFGSGCTPFAGWYANDLLDGQLRWDSTHAGGPFYGTQADAQAALAPGHELIWVIFVWDAGWLYGDSVVWFDNLRVNEFAVGEPVDPVVSQAIGAVSGAL